MPQQVSNLQSINGLCVPKQSSACSPTTGTREPVVNHFCCLQRRGSSRVSKVVKEKFTSLGKGPTVSFRICSSGVHFQSESLSKYAWGAVEVQCIEVAVQVKEKIYGNFQCQYEGGVLHLIRGGFQQHPHTIRRFLPIPVIQLRVSSRSKSDTVHLRMRRPTAPAWSTLKSIS